MVSKTSYQNEVSKHAYCNSGDLQTVLGCKQQRTWMNFGCA